VLLRCLGEIEGAGEHHLVIDDDHLVVRDGVYGVDNTAGSAGEIPVNFSQPFHSVTASPRYAPSSHPRRPSPPLPLRR
jgi:hypothetical protein